MEENYQQEFIFAQTEKIEYKVDDIVPKDISALKIILILESPYKDEVASQCPIAGASGKAIAKFFNSIDPSIPPKLPLGKFVKQSNDKRFAIINCSNYPMDINAYASKDFTQPNALPYQPEILDKIRKTIQTVRVDTSTFARRASAQNEFYRHLSSLLSDLKVRLSCILNSSALVVVCGNIARNFLILSGAASSIPSDNLVYVPHPSRNQWSQAKYKELMNSLKVKIQKL